MQILAPLFALEPLGQESYRGHAPDDGSPRIFGGQLIAQSLLAAYETAGERACHSLHAYFLLPGDPALPIVYQVERARDGGSFVTRRVIARQDGREVFTLMASFQAPHEGLDHQAPAPAAPPPEALADETEREAAALAHDPTALALFRRRLQRRAIALRGVEPHADGRAPRQRIWMRSTEPLGRELKRQHAVLAYASDLALMRTALRPHGLDYHTPGLQVVSLDHSLWFHRPSDFHDWHLYAMESDSASAGRGMNRGAFYTRDGVLVASAAQESVLRIRAAAAVA